VAEGDLALLTKKITLGEKRILVEGGDTLPKIWNMGRKRWSKDAHGPGELSQMISIRIVTIMDKRSVRANKTMLWKSNGQKLAKKVSYRGGPSLGREGRVRKKIFSLLGRGGKKPLSGDD